MRSFTEVADLPRGTGVDAALAGTGASGQARAAARSCCVIRGRNNANQAARARLYAESSRPRADSTPKQLPEPGTVMRAPLLVAWAAHQPIGSNVRPACVKRRESNCDERRNLALALKRLVVSRSPDRRRASGISPARGPIPRGTRGCGRWAFTTCGTRLARGCRHGEVLSRQRGVM
jgi:hypothetical protein